MRRFEVNAPPKYIKAAGPTLTVSELRQAMASVPGWMRLSAGFGTMDGFDSCQWVHHLLHVDGAWYFLCDTGWPEAAPGVPEITFKYHEHNSWPLYGARRAGIVAEALQDAPNDAPVYLAYRRPRVFSPVGRHFIVPITTAGVEVLTRFTTDDDGVVVDQIFTVVPDCLSLWGEV